MASERWTVIQVDDAKEFLQQVKMADTKINMKLEEMERTKALVLKVTSALRMDAASSSSGHGDKIGDSVSKIVDLEREINEAIDRYADVKREVSAVLDLVKDPNQLQVLHKRYFEFLTWEQIACDMGMTYRNVCYIHGRALQAVTEILKEGSKDAHNH